MLLVYLKDNIMSHSSVLRKKKKSLKHVLLTTCKQTDILPGFQGKWVLPFYHPVEMINSATPLPSFNENCIRRWRYSLADSS